MELSDKIEDKFRLDENHKKALRRMNLFSVHDLLFYFPARYSHISEIKPINQLGVGDYATICGRFWSPDIKKGYKSKIIRAEGEVADETGKIKVLWFNQAYIAKMLKSGDFVELTGKVMEGKHGKYLANPEFRKMKNMPIDIHDSLFSQSRKEDKEIFGFPVYNESRGITSKWIYHAILKILKDKTLDKIEDYIPKEILEKYHLPSLKSALFWIHSPKTEKDAESARKRFAFEEVFFIQLERQKDKHDYQKYKSFRIEKNKKQAEDFMKSFPFTPTTAQKKAIDVILEDLSKNTPMSRLLEGDVGSGKTAVAATATYAITQGKIPENEKSGTMSTNSAIAEFVDITKKKTSVPENLQVAYMAPTEILATQHFESFIKYFNPTPNKKTISVGLITGSGCRKFPSKINPKSWTAISRAQLLKWVANGEIPIVIGTHTLIQKSVRFKNLALAIIDEQHRFGTAQRKKLVKKEGVAPHLLSMTATPIPRTLALTIYGDLDLTLLDEMPEGRKNIITEIILPEKREEIYQKIRQELKAGRQMYVICPRIDEPDPEKEIALLAKSAIAEAKRLKREVFPEYEIGVLHSKMSKEKKEETMKDFSEGKTHILCATSVVEVGVNVENATIIIIEGAERFGLAQLHQLRGRVIRSNHQAYCFVFAEAKTEKTMNRLKALKNAKNGFELAELDLSLRGGGELGGVKQWGVSDLGMEAIKNIKMVEAARAEATRLISEDPELKKYPLLKERVKEKVSEFHFE